MLNDSIWKDVDENESELLDIQLEVVATLSYDELNDEWEIETEFNDYIWTFKASNLKEAKWMATVEINNHCNEMIRNYSLIRDHLPSLKQLYDGCH